MVRWKVLGSLELTGKWMNRYFLKLNPSKTQVTAFHPDSKVSKLHLSQVILCDGSYIQISDEVYNLGKTVNPNL